MTDDRGFEYTSDMKDYYKSENIAEEYHDAFTDNGNRRHKLIANRERSAIETLLRKVPHETVLDIPTGTGKLAPVFADTESEVLACDISEDMLQIARTEYNHVGVSDVRFQICDAEEITDTIDERFDVAVSLRLLHRVPGEIKRNILAELGAVADHVIASTAIETRFHAFRRSVRKQILDGDERNHCYESPKRTKSIFSDGFEIVATKRVLPVLSQEHIFLLKPTDD